MIIKQHKPTPPDLKHAFAGLSVRAALLTLAQRYNARGRVFYVRREGGTTSQCCTVLGALTQLPVATLEARCDRVIVSFTGGPPGRRALRLGTVLTLLCDGVLLEAVRN